MRNALIYLLIMLFPASLIQAQEADSSAVPRGKTVNVTGAFIRPLQERDSILVADQILYGFDLKQVEEGTPLAFPEIPQEQDDRLLFLSPWKIDTVKVTKQKKGMPRLLDIRGSVVISSFEEGNYELPRITLGRMSENGAVDTLVFDPVRMEVRTLPVDTATFQPHDIKGQIRYPVTFEEIFPWLAAGWLSAVLIILAICLVIIHRRRNDPESVRKEPAHIVALRKLDRYRGNKLWAPEKQKAFYSGITDALREYIVARYGIPAMEMTTSEIFDDMKKTDAPKELLAEIRDLFERADFVKFAKYVASDEDNASALPVAVRFVTQTYQTEIEEEEKKETGTEVKDGGKE